jgi:plastocyanin
MKKIIPIVTVIILAATTGALTLGRSDTNKGLVMESGMPDSSPSSSKPEIIPKANEVIINDFALNPEKMTVKKGTTVTWTNNDPARHDIMPDEESANFKPSQLLAKGDSYSFTFGAAGIYNYHCSPHPYMKATIEVTE